MIKERKGRSGARDRILVVNVNWVGDVLFSTPFIRALREAYPESMIACLIHPRCREVLELNSRLNQIIDYDEEGVHRSLFGKARLIAEIRQRHFDAAFILHRSFTKALITMLAGIPERIGFDTKGRGRVLTTAVEEPAGDVHKVEYFLTIARASGIRPAGPSYEFFVADEDRAFADRFLRSHGVSGHHPLVVICPGGNWDPKRWPWENYARLIISLEKRAQARVIIAGARKDIALAERIREAAGGGAIVACGATTLKQLGALFERADLAIANDTGPMHVAAAMKTNVIALFGPTSPALTGPYGDGLRTVIAARIDCTVPCYDASCAKSACMAAIPVADVVTAAERMLVAR